MSTSTIPAFKAALLARLQADSGLADVDVTYGLPFPRKPEGEWVWLGGVPDSSQETAAMGQRRREETWVQEVVVSCVRPVRESQQELTERAFVIAGVVETSLRTWSASPPYFGGVVREALVIGTSLEEFADAEEREARITVRIYCTNRI